MPNGWNLNTLYPAWKITTLRYAPTTEESAGIHRVQDPVKHIVWETKKNTQQTDWIFSVRL